VDGTKCTQYVKLASYFKEYKISDISFRSVGDFSAWITDTGQKLIFNMKPKGVIYAQLCEFGRYCIAITPISRTTVQAEESTKKKNLKKKKN